MIKTGFLGYFLGHEFIKKFEANTILKEIVLWSEKDIETRFISGLKSIAGNTHK
jgi:hypothetical protein